MKIHPVTLKDIPAFLAISKRIYANNAYYRRANEDVAELLLKSKTVFKKKAVVKPFFIMMGNEMAGRFAFINDSRNPNLIMLAFFEALPGLHGVADLIIDKAQQEFPDARKLCVGLDGHLNYGAGILLSNYDSIPAYGLAYTMPYYPEYFSHFNCHRLLTYSFPVIDTGNAFDALIQRQSDIKIRCIDKRNLKEEVKIYTRLNNTCFASHIFWTERDWEEDYEMFFAFRHLIDNENLLFAEYKGEPVGFLLWFSDFNKMIKQDRILNADYALSLDVLKFRFFNRIRSLRLAEIAVLPEFQRKSADLLMLKRMFDYSFKKGYRKCEGGFISESNKKSVNLSLRYIERITGEKVEPLRTYAVYEKDL